MGFYLLRKYHTISEIVELLGLNMATVQDINTKIDKYGSHLSHQRTGQLLKINERTERHLKRIIRNDPFTP